MSCLCGGLGMLGCTGVRGIGVRRVPGCTGIIRVIKEG